MCDIDPDIIFFDEIDYHLVSQCNYFRDNHFISAVKNRFLDVSLSNIFSLCHINIRSLKANSSAFELCLNTLEIEFSAIGMSETWLHDCNYHFYNVECYNLIENHRSIKRVAEFLFSWKNGTANQNRHDLKLVDDVYESVYIEIDKDVFEQKKKYNPSSHL